MEHWLVEATDGGYFRRFVVFRAGGKALGGSGGLSAGSLVPRPFTSLTKTSSSSGCQHESSVPKDGGGQPPSLDFHAPELA
jgi:hypothetical protein